jgi:hypothetical protein
VKITDNLESAGPTLSPAAHEILPDLLKQIDPKILEALIYGYLAAKENGLNEGQHSQPPDSNSAQPKDPLEDYHPAPETRSLMLGAKNLSQAFNFDQIFTNAALSSSSITSAASDPTHDIIGSIFEVFSRKGIPITTATVPSTQMAMGNWVEIGRAIFASVVKKYPSFTKFADPTRLPRFYGEPLLTFAKAIRDAIAAA